MSQNSQSSTTAGAEFAFQAEVNQVLDIVVNSLYSHREVFLRELISNASDALDKLRFRSLTETDLLGEDKELKVRLVVDADAKTLTISDNGVGMTRSEMIDHLGTIAKSGSKAFKQALADKGEGAVDLIGQFGVGFYSAFLVADRVEVRSRAAGSAEGHIWISEARGRFTVNEAVDAPVRGTDIILHIKEDQSEYLDEWRLKELIRRYSDFVGYPIFFQSTTKDGGVEWNQVNQASALWKRPKAEITTEQYDEFYKHLTHDWEEPLARTHFTIEGTRLFSGLLFIPKRPPFDLYDRDKRRGVRLYVKRVFIMDDCEALLPEWLRFVRGVVDSDDLPLNVSRELLQEDRIVKDIHKSVTRKVLDLIESLAADKPEDYRVFWDNYGSVLKEGLHFDPSSRDRLAKLVRYHSSKSDLTGLEDYVKRMPEDQKEIYYAMGPTLKAVENSAHIEGLRRRNWEVLFMVDSIDEWALHGLGEFEGRKLVSVMKADFKGAEESAEDKSKSEEQKTALEKLIERFKTVLGDDIEDVRTSNRLTTSPCCLVVPEHGMHAHIERMMRAHNKDMPSGKRILELNPVHPVVERLRVLEEEKPASDEVAEWIRLLRDQALIAEGSPIEDPAAFSHRLTRLMTRGL